MSLSPKIVSRYRIAKLKARYGPVWTEAPVHITLMTIMMVNLLPLYDASYRPEAKAAMVRAIDRIRTDCDGRRMALQRLYDREVVPFGGMNSYKENELDEYLR